MQLRVRSWILGSQALSSLGTSMSAVALAFMVNELTGSMVHMGAVLAISTLPLAIASFLGGAFLDRYPCKTMMILSDVARAVLMFLMPLLAQRAIIFVYVVAALVGVFTALFNPAQMKLVAEIAAGRDLVKLNSYLGVSRDTAELIGYLAGGAVVAAIGFMPTFMVDGGTYVLSGILLLGLPRSSRSPVAQPTVGALLAETPKVFTSLWRQPGLRANLLFAVLPIMAIFFYGPNSYGLVLDVFGAGGFELGLMELVIACGAITGGVVISRLSLKGDKNLYVAGALIVMSFVLLGVSFVGSLWPAIALLGVGGMANVALLVPSITMFQQASGRQHAGRLLALRAGFGQASLTAGYLLGGILGEKVGIQTTFFIAGLAAAILTIVIYVPYRIAGNRRANVAWKAAVAEGQRRAVAREAAAQARLGGHHGVWPSADDRYVEEES